MKNAREKMTEARPVHHSRSSIRSVVAKRRM